MLVPSFIFREYDLRGVANRDLSDDTVQAIGRALGGMLKGRDGRPPRLALGRDCRLSSPRLRAAMLEGLLRGGANVLDVGVGPTPQLYFAVHHLDTDGGVMITGSHNPADENGFKVMRGKASFFGKDIQDLLDAHRGGDLHRQRCRSGAWQSGADRRRHSLRRLPFEVG